MFFIYQVPSDVDEIKRKNQAEELGKPDTKKEKCQNPELKLCECAPVQLVESKKDLCAIVNLQLWSIKMSREQ